MQNLAVSRRLRSGKVPAWESNDPGFDSSFGYFFFNLKK